jgi:hypothetical protein
MLPHVAHAGRITPEYQSGPAAYAGDRASGLSGTIRPAADAAVPFEYLDRLADMAVAIRRDKTALRIDEQGSSPTNEALIAKGPAIRN